MEVTKLLVVEIIYPILDSQWVSLVQVVPKKSGMMVVKNQHDEMVPTRIQNNRKVCIDYRKLNQATCKDHFPLPLLINTGIEVDKAKVDVTASLSNLASVWEGCSFLGNADRPTSVQAAIEGHGFCIRPDLRRCFPRVEEETHVCTCSPSTKLGVFVRVDVRRVQLCARSLPRSKSRQAATCHRLCISNHGSDLDQLYNYGKGAIARSEAETDLVDAAPSRVRFGDQRQERCKECHICNFLAKSIYPQGATRADKERLESDAKYYIWDDPYLWRLCNDQLEEAMMDRVTHLEKSETVGYIDPPFPEMHMHLSRHSNNAREFGVSKALINDQGNHFYNRAMATLLESMGWCIELPPLITPRPMAKLKLSLVKLVTYRLRLNTKATGQLRSATWPTTKSDKKGNYSCRSWKSCAWKHMRTLGSTKKRILRKVFRVGQKLIVGKLRSSWDGPFVVTNIFPYGVVELRDEANNRNFKVNGHQLKLYYEGLSSNMGEVAHYKPNSQINHDPP
ncbi:hypothetical protein CR513_33673, partial [Mucuna pruriens]